MFDPTDRPRVFALPPGADFPRLLVAGLLDRMRGAPPEALARVTLYVNTRRMQRRIRQMFTETGARLLPRLHLVTDLGAGPFAALPPAIPALRRRLELARLITRLLEQERDFAPGTAVHDLADSLARLMDEMQGEGVAPAALEHPSLAENHAAHWERSLRFIRIVARYFDADAAPDPEARQRRVVEALIARWADTPPADPVIVAGSTGSRGTTALLMRAVARLPKGAVVLPGYDFDMDADAWASLDASPVPTEDHPQYRFRRLTADLGLASGDVERWTQDPPPNAARNSLVSLALRPAPVTDQWMERGPTLSDLREATREVTLIEAPSPRAEALAIALALREAAETGIRAALISPDRMLTRRVAAALDRWGIFPDDSAGQPLALSPPGRLLRHVAGLFGRPVAMDALLTLLKHPLTATGHGQRGDHLRFSRDLELRLRRHGPAFPDRAALTAWAGSDDPPRALWADWLGTALADVATAPDAPLSACVETHVRLTEHLASGPGGSAEASGLWREAAGAEAQMTMAELAREAPHGGSYSPAAYADLVSALLQAGSARQPEAVHPTISIWGTLEARVQGAELVILGGLNEGVWPQAPAPDPWLSRQMRRRAGLLLPERRIGLSAHDFQQAIAARRVILTRAVRDAEAETVPSRWLNRLGTLMRGLDTKGGPQAWQAMQHRGRDWLGLAAALEAPARPLPEPAKRPAPCPPVAVRPHDLSVTAIQTLIRDPYAIYARHILRLTPLDPMRPVPDPRMRGIVLHRIVEAFVRDRPASENPDAARARLMQIADRILAEEIPWPSARRLWLARLERIAVRFVLAEADRLTKGVPTIVEEKGVIQLPDLGFTLTARPDRIDLLADGRVHIYDYKSGAPPTKHQQTHFDKQMLLEAAMAERGAFRALGARRVDGVTHIRLGGAGEQQTLRLDDADLAEAWDGLHRLIGSYLRPDQGFASRRAVVDTDHAGDYDHLARFGEWEMHADPSPEKVG